jgi:hypothetical protein
MLENNRNSTVSARAFSGTSSWGGGAIEGQAIQGNMELNHMYQLKIGNYETFIMNQTGPVQFNIQDTNRSLEVLIGAPSYLSPDPFAPPSHNITITYTREPSLYLFVGLVALDATLQLSSFSYLGLG